MSHHQFVLMGSGLALIICGVVVSGLDLDCIDTGGPMQLLRPPSPFKRATATRLAMSSPASGIRGAPAGPWSPSEISRSGGQPCAGGDDPTRDLGLDLAALGPVELVSPVDPEAAEGMGVAEWVQRAMCKGMRSASESQSTEVGGSGVVSQDEADSERTELRTEMGAAAATPERVRPPSHRGLRPPSHRGSACGSSRDAEPRPLMPRSVMAPPQPSPRQQRWNGIILSDHRGGGSVTDRGGGRFRSCCAADCESGPMTDRGGRRPLPPSLLSAPAPPSPPALESPVSEGTKFIPRISEPQR